MNIGGFLRRNGVAIVLLASFSGCSGLVIYPIFQSAATNVRRSSCQANLKLIALACQQYQADYEGKFPPLSDGDSRGWSQILLARASSLKFSCPAGYKSSFSPTSDYFFNARLAARKGSSVRNPAMTISFGDGVDNGPTNSHYWELPNDSENLDSVLVRHLNGSNYAFVDGHIQWLRYERLSEWLEDETGRRERRFRFSPDESASRPKAHQKIVSPTPDPQTKRLHDLVHAARSFESKN